VTHGILAWDRWCFLLSGGKWVVCLCVFVCVCVCLLFLFVFFSFVSPFVLLSGGRGDEDAANEPNGTADGKRFKIVRRHSLT